MRQMLCRPPVWPLLTVRRPPVRPLASPVLQVLQVLQVL